MGTNLGIWNRSRSRRALLRAMAAYSVPLAPALVGMAFVAQAFAGASPVQITFSESDGIPAWSPSGSEIVFSSSRTGSEGMDLWIIPSAGGAATQVTNSVSNEYSASWSPDGTTLVYYWAWEGTLFTIPATGGTPLQLLSIPTADEEPQWSPNGDAIAYASSRDPQARGSDFDIWIQPLPTGDPFPLTSHAAEDRDPTWSPDGEHIVFVSDRDGSPALWKLLVAGGPALKIADAPATHPDWSPDGAWIVYSSFDDLFVVPAAGGDPIPVTDGPDLDAYPSWSPSSSEIVFMRVSGSSQNLWVVDWEPTSVERESWAKIKSRYR